MKRSWKMKSHHEKTEFEKKLEAEIAAEAQEAQDTSNESVPDTSAAPEIDVEAVVRERAALA
ncbi:MAG TPA: hypothetical protein PK869_13445, partial [Candidatus Hydrogenedentes bacterium]|nr:hypothetical protein [Candidatus Hydrogenedentota bacterium]